MAIKLVKTVSQIELKFIILSNDLNKLRGISILNINCHVMYNGQYVLLNLESKLLH